MIFAQNTRTRVVANASIPPCHNVDLFFTAIQHIVSWDGEATESFRHAMTESAARDRWRRTWRATTKILECWWEGWHGLAGWWWNGQAGIYAVLVATTLPCPTSARDCLIFRGDHCNSLRVCWFLYGLYVCTGPLRWICWFLYGIYVGGWSGAIITHCANAGTHVSANTCTCPSFRSLWPVRSVFEY